MAENQAVFPVARSHKFNRALVNHSYATSFLQPAQVRNIKPGQLNPKNEDPATIMGCMEQDIIPVGVDGMVIPQWIFLQPFCRGPAGTNFFMNVWGYTDIGGDSQPGGDVWLPFFIVQLMCIAGDIPGTGPTSQLADSENLCDTLFPTMGSLGSGSLNAQGAGFGAWVTLELLGAKYFFLEFAADPNASGLPINPLPGMNAFWRPL